MLKLIVEVSEEYFDEDAGVFVKPDTVEIELEHSLVTLSKWESEFEKPFLGREEKTAEEIMGYVRHMIQTPDLPPDILDRLSDENIQQINAYIDRKMTATWFNEPKTASRNREQITSELIYYWLVSYEIPWVVENWHLNRLFTLIKVFNVKNEKPKKISAQEAAKQRAELNARRKAQMGTNG